MTTCGPLASAQDVQVALDKPTYVQGEPIQIVVSYTGDLRLMFPDTLTNTYILDGAYMPSYYVYDVVTYTTGPFSGNHTFDWSDHLLTPGQHCIEGIVPGTPSPIHSNANFQVNKDSSGPRPAAVFNPTSPPVYFTILPFPKPQRDFLLDFTSWPGTERKITNLSVYEVFGLRFRTSLGAPALLEYSAGNQYLSGFDPTPVGYNVAVDFSLPVCGAQAAVDGAAGITVTMTAKDVFGEVITNAISPVLGSGRVKMELRTATPVATLEWWPSDPTSHLKIDDLWIRVMPTVNPSASNGTFQLNWAVVTGETYRIWTSSNLLDWIAIDPTIVGVSNVASHATSMTEAPARFYRVSRIPLP